MPSQPIPFANAQSSGMDELSGGVVVAMNVITEPQGAVRRRPGIRLIDEAPEEPLADGPVTGLFYTQNRKLIAVVDSATERPIYNIASGVATALGGGVEPAGLRGTSRPSFAETPMLLVLAGGDLMQKIELATLVSNRLGGDPPYATHVVALASRLVANESRYDPGLVRYSDVATGIVTYAGHETWTLGVGDAGSVVAEGRPDPALTLITNTNELLVFGTNTIQIYAPDENLVFAPVSSRDIGTGAANSVVSSDHQFFWLDEKRRINLGDGRNYEVVSDPVKRDLERLDPRGCFGYRVVTGPLDGCVWTFPESGKTYALQKGGGWSQWQKWTGGAWAQFPVTVHCQRWSDGANLVGLEDGRVAELSFDASTDLGTPIRAYIRTGYLSRGTDARKQCISVRLLFRRGEQPAAGPHGWLRFRDREGSWQSIPIDLGQSPDYEATISIRGLGVYRQRQWEFEHVGSEDFVLVSASEEFEILEA